jgi:hypothetical protein
MNTIDAAEQRKLRSEEYLRSLGVPFNLKLPLVEDEGHAKLRPPKEVAEKAFVLYYLVSVAHGFDRNQVSSQLKEQNLWQSVSLKEKEFLGNNNLSHQDLVDASWRVEGLWILLWALGQISEVGAPSVECDPQTIQTILSTKDPSEFVGQAVLRSTSEILDETDLIYRIHWAVVDSRLNDQPTPDAFIPGIVYERHYALNWLTCYADNWDDITTDT